MADAAARSVSRRQKRDEDVTAAVGWLKAKREEMGLVSLAKLVGMDAADLSKVIEGKRKPSGDQLEKIAAVRSQT